MSETAYPNSAGWLIAFRPADNLLNSRRITVTRPSAAGISAAEIAMLLAMGVLAALAIGLLRFELRVPGHAILRGVLPMAIGLALVPRRGSGMVMSIGAGLTAAAMSWGHVGHFPPAAILSVVLLGPVLDFVLAGTAKGWKLYAFFAAAGGVTNLIAFAVRYGLAVAGWELSGGGRQFASFWSVAIVSFLLCGIVAGLVSAAVCFRLGTKE